MNVYTPTVSRIVAGSQPLGDRGFPPLASQAVHAVRLGLWVDPFDQTVAVMFDVSKDVPDA